MSAIGWALPSAGVELDGDSPSPQEPRKRPEALPGPLTPALPLPVACGLL